MQPIDDRRAMVHGMWDSVSSHWAEHAAYADDRGASLAKAMLDAAGLAAGSRVLELACGPAGLGLAAADLVGPSGEVTLSDVAPGMVAVAAARAAERGLANVRTAVRDIEAIDEPDASFDALLCREGLMFAVEPARAFAEVARVLRPGGRVAFAVWGAPHDNPWLSIVFRAVVDVTGMVVPPPGVPGPFALGDEALVRGLVAGAGLAGGTIERFEVPVHAASFEAWWHRTSALAGPLANIVAMLDEEVRGRLEARLGELVAPYTAGDGTIAIPGVSLLGAARRP